jgi:chromosome segregation ATPase
MPPKKRKAAPEEENTVTLLTEEGYHLPTWFSSASPQEIGRALTFAAAVFDGTVPPTLSTQLEVSTAIAKVKEESMQRRESQLVAHEQAMQSIIAEHKMALDIQQNAMQKEIDRLTILCEQEQGRAKGLIQENDELQEKFDELESRTVIAKSSSEHLEPVRTHFEGLTTHTQELLTALHDHHVLVEKLDISAAKLRAKVFAYYRHTKRLNMDTPFLQVPMQLSFEDAFEFAKMRPWNNVTHAKQRELEIALGKKNCTKDALVAIDSEPVKPS